MCIRDRLLPTPGAVIVAFGENLPLIWHHSLYTLAEAGLGMILAVIVSLGIASVSYTHLDVYKRQLYPCFKIKNKNRKRKIY